MFLISNKLEQLEFILEKKMGFRNMPEKLEKRFYFLVATLAWPSSFTR